MTNVVSPMIDNRMMNYSLRGWVSRSGSDSELRCATHALRLAYLFVARVTVNRTLVRCVPNPHRVDRFPDRSCLTYPVLSYRTKVPLEDLIPELQWLRSLDVSGFVVVHGERISQYRSVPKRMNEGLHV